jgi:hypothetical protein
VQIYSNFRGHYWLVPDRFLLGIQDLTFDGGYKKERIWPELLGFLVVTLTNPYWWSRDFNKVYVEWNKARQLPFEM